MADMVSNNVANTKVRRCNKHWAYNEELECLITDVLNENLNTELIDTFVKLGKDDKHFVYLDANEDITTNDDGEVIYHLSIRYPGLTVGEITLDMNGLLTSVEFISRHEGKYIFTEPGMNIVRTMVNNVRLVGFNELGEPADRSTLIPGYLVPTISNVTGVYPGIEIRTVHYKNEKVLPDYKKKVEPKLQRTLPEFKRCNSCKCKVEISTLVDDMCLDCRGVK